MPRWAHSLQFRLTAGFTLILAGALLSVSAFAYTATERKIDDFSDEVSQARAERLDQVVSDSYQRFDGWDGVQDALEQVSRLYDWRVVIEDETGLIVGDSHSVFDLNPLLSPTFFRRPVVVGGIQMGSFFIEPGKGFVGPPGDSFGFIAELERLSGEKVDIDDGLRGRQQRLRSERLGESRDDDRDDDSVAGFASPVAPAVSPATEPQLSELASSFNRSLLWSGLFAAAAGIGMVTFTTRRALAPVRQLSAAAAGVAQGDLSQRVDASVGSELGELGLAFNEMAGALEDSESERRRLVADIAHELRSPLTNIQGYLEAIKDGVLDADERTIDTIYSQTKHLGALVEDLRLLALVEAGSLRLELIDADLGALVSDTAEAFRPRAAEQDIQLIFTSQNDLPSTRLDPTRIRQVISNLIENAITHTPNGGRVEVTVERSPAEGDALVTISDTGSGISAEDLPHVFDRFYRVDPSRNRVTGGAGLGLTIVKRLAEVHDGTVRAASEIGVGTSFTVELPFAGPNSDD